MCGKLTIPQQKNGEQQRQEVMSPARTPTVCCALICMVCRIVPRQFPA